ncbi:MAG: thioredoxin family protein, partial [Leptospiraceae bacterium]|nr:thioredoxin family protein [Leptospiraceae bacterium]
MVRTAVIFLFTIFFAASAQAEGLEWKTSIDSGLQAARQSNRLMYVEIVAPWCGYCRKLRTQDYPRAAVQKVLAQFVTVTIDGDATPEVANRYGARGYPTLLVLAPDGRILGRLDGYPGSAGLIRFLESKLDENQMARAEPSRAEAITESGRPLLIRGMNSFDSGDLTSTLKYLDLYIANAAHKDSDYALARFYRGLSLIGLARSEEARTDLDFAAR